MDTDLFAICWVKFRQDCKYGTRMQLEHVGIQASPSQLSNIWSTATAALRAEDLPFNKAWMRVETQHRATLHAAHALAHISANVNSSPDVWALCEAPRRVGFAHCCCTNPQS